jgi:hypothetical protein
MLCAELNGGLFRVETSGGVSCAIVEKEQNGAVLIKELLAPNSFEEDAISSIAAVFPSKEYIIRMPVRKPGDTNSFVRRFGMISVTGDLLNHHINTCNTMPWFGLAFD